jgi:hypothetical protein
MALALDGTGLSQDAARRHLARFTPSVFAKKLLAHASAEAAKN